MFEADWSQNEQVGLVSLSVRTEGFFVQVLSNSVEKNKLEHKISVQLKNVEALLLRGTSL